MMMGGWSDLSEDLVRTIARRLTVAVDRVRFSAVCKWWEFVAKSERNYLPRRPPWLMLAENSSTAECSKRGFVGLSSSDDEEEEKVFEVDFPEGRGNKCLGSTGTWLITADERLGMHLLNPLTRDHIELPPISTFGRIYEELDSYDEEGGRPSNLDYRDIFFKKAVLRWLPPDHQQEQGQEQEQDYMVIAIYHTTRVLAFTRRCSKSWTTIEIHSAPLFCDVIFYNAKGKFYGVTHRGVVMEIDIDIDDGGSDPKTIQVFGPFNRMDDNLPSNYLVECSGQLFQVIKFIDDLDDDRVYETKRFEVFALDFANGTRTELNSLGRHSLFLGDNTSVALSADSFSTTTFNANCIYFTDDYKLGYMGNEKEGGRDMGVFNLESGTIKPHCKRVSLSYFSPPLWIIP